MKQGHFREDLWYRVNVFPITAPPVRQRKEDIPLLATAFLKRFAKKLGKPVRSIGPEAMAALQEYHWPGNVRELENIMERALIVSEGPVMRRRATHQRS